MEQINWEYATERMHRAIKEALEWEEQRDYRAAERTLAEAAHWATMVIALRGK